MQDCSENTYSILNSNEEYTGVISGLQCFISDFIFMVHVIQATV